MLAIDTHSFVKRLTKAGMPEEQAEILAEEQTRLLHDRVATKEDIATVNARIDNLETTVNAKIDNSMAVLRAEFNRKFHLLYWMLALIILATVVPFVREIFSYF